MPRQQQQQQPGSRAVRNDGSRGRVEDCNVELAV